MAIWVLTGKVRGYCTPLYGFAELNTSMSPLLWLYRQRYSDMAAMHGVANLIKHYPDMVT